MWAQVFHVFVVGEILLWACLVWRLSREGGQDSSAGAAAAR
jgi:hypothetical protein